MPLRDERLAIFIGIVSHCEILEGAFFVKMSKKNCILYKSVIKMYNNMREDKNKKVWRH